MSRWTILTLVAAVAAALPYLQLLGAGPLSLDDPGFFTAQTYFTDPSWTETVQLFVHPNFGSYHPLHQFSYLLERLVGGPRPWWLMRLDQLLLYSLSCALVVVLARRLRFPLVAAATTALVFAWHPVHVENVAWISARKDLLSLLGFLGALLIYLGPRPRGLTELRPDPPPWRAVGWALLVFALALLSKAVAMLLTPVLVLIALARGSLRTEAGRLLPFAALSAAAVVGHYLSQQGIGTTVATPTDQFERVVWALIYYVKTGLWPASLSPLRHRPLTHGVGLGVALLLPLGWGITYSWLRGQRRFAVLGLWFVGTLTPTLGIIPTPVWVQDRYLLLPSLALALGLGLLVASLGRGHQPQVRRRRRLFLIVTAAGLVALTIQSSRYARAWSNSLELWSWALREEPDSAFLLARFANALFRTGLQERDPERQQQLFARAQLSAKQALIDSPNSPIANRVLAQLASRDGELERAAGHLRRALGSGSPIAYTAGLLGGKIMLELGDLEQARAIVAQTREVAPPRPRAQEVPVLEAELLLVQGQPEQAAALLESVVLVYPGFRPAWTSLAEARRRLGQPQAAWEALERAAAGEPRESTRLALLVDEGQLEAARDVLASLGPGSAGHEVGRARLLQAEGDPQGAAAVLEALLARTRPGARLALAADPQLRGLLELK